MREKPLMRIEKHLSLERKQPYPSRFVIPPPSSLSGYHLQLIGNSPSRLTPQELHASQQKIDTFRETQNGKGAWDALKVNITSADVVTSFTDHGEQQAIQYTTAPATYFQHRAGIDEHTPYETARKLSHSGVMAIGITGDDKIVLSTRPDNVNLYPRTLTTTASGSWEGQPQTPIKKNANGATRYEELPQLIPPTPKSALEQMQAEFHEETGIPLSYLTSDATKTTLVGIAEDNQKRHWDLLWMVQLPQEITQTRLKEYLTAEKQNGHNTNDPMAGHLIFLDKTPERVEQFLTQNNAFWDGNADKALLAVGKMLVLERYLNQDFSPQDANRQAEAWMERVDEQLAKRRTERNAGIKEYRRRKIREARQARRKAIGSEFVQTFNVVNREKVREARQTRRQAGAILDEFRGRPKRYSPILTPEEQGGRSVKQALEEIGHPTD